MNYIRFPFALSVLVTLACVASDAMAANDGATNAAGGIEVSAQCNRACLEQAVGDFLMAITAKDPSRVSWTKDARYSENNVELPIGDGLWGTASEPGTAEQGVTFADVNSGQAVYLGVLQEREEPVFIALRLQVVRRHIKEAEVIVNRKSESGARGNPDRLVHDPSFIQSVPVAERTPRALLIERANGYFNTMQKNDGRLFTQFEGDCSRRENGMMMANDGGAANPLLRLSCADQFKTGYFRFDDRVRARDFFLVDEERGIVVARGFIDHSGRLDAYALADGTIRRSTVKAPHSWHFMEAFKIEHGSIRNIESIFIYVPYGMPSPWSKGREDRGAATTAETVRAGR